MADDPTQKTNILIVDDSLTNLSAFSEYLAAPGNEVSVAANGTDALTQIGEHKPDIILLDVMMPGIDGFETCRRLKSNPATKHIPVIFMTSLADTVDKVKGLGLGAVDYVTKPFQEEEILARIKTHVTVSRLQEELHARNMSLQQEIQQRKQAEAELQQRNQALRYSETRFRDLVMSLSDWVWEFDEHFHFTYSSDKVMDLLGLRAEEVPGKSLFEVMPDETARELESQLTGLLANKLPIKALEHHILHADGHTVCLETNGLPILDDNGRVTGYRGASKDITERKELEELSREYSSILEMEVTERIHELEEKNASLQQKIQERKQIEEDLHENEKRWRKLMDEVRIGLMLVRKDGSIVEINPACAAITGYSVEEMLQLRALSKLTPTQYGKIDEEQFHLLQTTGRFGPYEKEYIHKDGHLVPVRLSGLMIEKKDEQLIWVNVEQMKH